MQEELSGFELSLEQAKSGYQNAQETVRFVDTKTGVMTGIVTVTTGIPFVLLQWLLSKDNPLSEYLATQFAHLHYGTWFVAIGGIFAVLGVFLGILSLISSTSGLMARTPRSRTSKNPSAPAELVNFCLERIGAKKRPVPDHALSALFPIFPSERSTEAERYFSKISKGEYDQKSVLSEYARQLFSIGSILDVKIRYNGYSIRFFELQISAYFVAVLLPALAWITNLFPD